MVIQSMEVYDFKKLAPPKDEMLGLKLMALHEQGFIAIIFLVSNFVRLL